MRIILFMLLALAAHTCFGEPRTFRAEYLADYQGLPVKAKGIRELARLPDGSYQLRSSASALFVKVDEISSFRVEDDRVVSVSYEYNRQGLGRKKQEHLLFDWEHQRVSHEEGGSTVGPGTLDKLSYQYQLRRDIAGENQRAPDGSVFSYTIADGDRIREYQFKVVGEETLSTPVGELITIRVERVRDDGKDQQTALWLAIDHDYLLVRLAQQEAGKGFELNLVSFTLEDTNGY